MDIKTKLQNPFALIAQGFIAGSIIFYATMPVETEARAPSASAAADQVREISRA